jgi:hypothetical protein
LAQEQMPPEILQQYQQIQQQMQGVSQTEQANLQMQANDLLAQFSAPIFAELVNVYTQENSGPIDEDPLVGLRRQEIALKGQELAQEQEQFRADQQRKRDDAMRQDQLNRERLALQGDIAEMKDDTTKDRLEQQRQLKLMDLAKK